MAKTKMAIDAPGGSGFVGRLARAAGFSPGPRPRRVRRGTA